MTEQEEKNWNRQHWKFDEIMLDSFSVHKDAISSPREVHTKTVNLCWIQVICLNNASNYIYLLTNIASISQGTSQHSL